MSLNGPMTNHLLCCDWGTSNFRLQLMDTATYACLGEIQLPLGIARTFDNWMAAGEGISRGRFYRRQLLEQIEVLAATVSISLTNVPVVLSGMASSSIGMELLPYAGLPFAVDGSQANRQYFDAQSDFPHDLLLISGVSSTDDVMRGEETQLIGLITLLDGSDQAMSEAIYIFPGTHSKHLHIQARKLIRFDTYMTGELFELIGKQSILKDSITLDSLSDFTVANKRAFRLGVEQSKSSVILQSLFKVRTNQLFGNLSKAENAFYLSGLLIGTELTHLVTNNDWPLILGSGSRLSTFYELAMDELKLTNRTMTIPAELIDRAASVGQIRLFQHQLTKQTTK